jgi:carbon-monoxide dehydrogenase small subunit
MFSKDLVAQVAQVASEEVTPIDDVRSTAWYRREAVRVLAYDGLHRAWQRAGQSESVEWISDADAPRQTEPSSTLRVGATEKRLIELCVNGRKHQVWVAPNDLLLNVLRDQLQLIGAKYGCGIGECSACTVLMNGEPALACLVLAVSAVGHDILTVEGLQKPNGELDPLQEAFLDFAAFQCGYCTPGMLLTAKSLLAEKPRPTEDDVREYLRGNLCRCTGYASVVRAVMSCAK